MKGSEFIQMCKDASNQNLSNTVYDDSNRVFYVKGGLDYIYAYLNLRGIWTYSSVEEEIVPVNKIATTTYPIHGMIISPFFGEDGEDDSDSGVFADGNRLVNGVNFFPRDGHDEFAFVTDKTGITGLKLGKDYGKIRLRYKRGPIYPDIGSLIQDIDIPVNLEPVLFNLCLWYANPIYLEGGINLANSFKQYADELLGLYAQNMSQGFINKVSG